MTNHKPCAVENKEFGAWEQVKKRFPWGWFFNYYEMKHGSNVYCDRKSKLDGLFDWICIRIDR